MSEKYKGKGDGSEFNSYRAGMSDRDRAELKKAGEDWGKAYKAGDEEAKAQAHRRAEEIRGRYGYSGGGDGSEYIRGEQKGPDFKGTLDAWLDAAQRQQKLEADYAVKRGVEQLEQARKEGEARLDRRADQVEREERLALDNHALYMEARGDRGGIGHAQYGTIQAQAMKDRQAVGDARMQLASETAQKIADLRAQGEFRKADALLKLTQEHLSRLTDLYKWQAGHDLDEKRFAAQLQQYDREFGRKVGEMMGSYEDRPTLAARKNQQDLNIRLGLAALQQGIRPSHSQQAALGWSDSQVEAMLQNYRTEQAQKHKGGSGGSKGSSGGSKGSSGGSSGGKVTAEDEYASFDAQTPAELKELDLYQRLYALGCRSGSDAFYMLNNRFGISDTRSRTLAGYFKDKVENGSLLDWWMGYEPFAGATVDNTQGGEGGHRWIAVPGAGRIGGREILPMVESGYLKRVTDPKTGHIRYVLNRKK